MVPKRNTSVVAAEVMSIDDVEASTMRLELAEQHAGKLHQLCRVCTLCQLSPAKHCHSIRPVTWENDEKL